MSCVCVSACCKPPIPYEVFLCVSLSCVAWRILHMLFNLSMTSQPWFLSKFVQMEYQYTNDHMAVHASRSSCNSCSACSNSTPTRRARAMARRKSSAWLARHSTWHKVFPPCEWLNTLNNPSKSSSLVLWWFWWSGTKSQMPQHLKMFEMTFLKAFSTRLRRFMKHNCSQRCICFLLSSRQSCSVQPSSTQWPCTKMSTAMAKAIVWCFFVGGIAYGLIWAKKIPLRITPKDPCNLAEPSVSSSKILTFSLHVTSGAQLLPSPSTLAWPLYFWKRLEPATPPPNPHHPHFLCCYMMLHDAYI